MSRHEKSSRLTKSIVEKRVSSPINSNLRFYIIKPYGHKRRWAIQPYIELERGKRQYLKKDSEIAKELAAKLTPINREFLAGKLNESTVKDMLSEIIETYIKRGQTKHFALKKRRISEANQKLLDTFWEKKYAHKSLADEASAKADFKRAIILAGDLSLYTATAKDLVEQLKQNCKTINQHRRAVSSLNELLKFLARDIRLVKPEEEYREVRYLNESEVRQLAESSSNEHFKMLTYVLFGTGARTGEAFAIDVNSLRDRAVHINKQVPLKKRKSQPDRIKKPKRGKTGWVTAIEWTWSYIQKWAEVDKTKVNRWQYYNWITTQSRKLWPTNKQKHVKPHDLRHSHAIYLLDKGVSIQAVARQLRNRVEICQKYYTGHEHTPESLELLKKKI